MKSSLSHLEAIGYSIAGFTFWVLGDSAVKLAGQSKLPNYEVVAFLGFFLAAFIAIYARLRGGTALWPKRPWRQMLRSLLDLGNNLCVVVALRHLPLTLFYILVFAAPMVIALLAAAFLHEHLNWRKSAAIVAGFLGVVIAVDPFGLRRGDDWIGFGACAISVLCFAVSMVWTRNISQTESAESMAFCSGLVMAAAGGAAMLVHAEPVHARLLLVLVAMGLLGTLGTLCYFVALKHTTAANVSQYHYTQLLSGAAVAYVVFGEKPTRFMLAGAVLIVASGLYIALVAAREGGTTVTK